MYLLVGGDNFNLCNNVVRKGICMTLIKIKRGLPATIGGLKKFILVGKEKIKTHRAKIAAINVINIPLTHLTHSNIHSPLKCYSGLCIL